MLVASNECSSSHGTARYKVTTRNKHNINPTNHVHNHTEVRKNGTAAELA